MHKRCATDVAIAPDRMGWVALGYGATWVALWLASYQLHLATGFSLWYPAAGLTFAILLECGAWALVLPVLASLLANALIWPWTVWPYYLAASLLPSFGYLGAALVLRAYSDGHGPTRLKDLRRVAAFLGASAGAALFSALVSAYSFGAADLLPARVPVWTVVLSGWIGEFVGVVTLAPLLLVHGTPWIQGLRQKPPSPSPPWCAIARGCAARPLLFQWVLSAGLLALLFWLPSYFFQARLQPSIALLWLPVLVWIVIKQGVRGSVWAVLGFELIFIVIFLVFGQAEWRWQYQVVMAAVAILGLITAAFFHEQSYNTVLFRDLAEISNDLLWEFDADGSLRTLRGQLAETIRLHAGTTGANWLRFIVEQEQDTDLVALREALEQRQPFRQKVLRMTLPGLDQPIWTRNSGLPMFGAAGEFLGYRGTTTDISDHKTAQTLQKKAEALLRDYNHTLEAKIEAKVEERTRALAEASLRNWRLANYDALTGLANRNLLFEHLRKGLQQARRQWRLLAILLVDLDGFKQVNDTYGHDAGDELLRQVAARLRQSIRASDTPARLGGDEFILLLPDLERPEMAVTVAEKIISCVAEPIALGATTVTVSASVGIAIYRPESPATLELAMSLLRQADGAMYEAKRGGKNGWRFAEQQASG